MRSIIKKMSLNLLLFGGVIALTQLVTNSRYIHLSTTSIHAYAFQQPAIDPKAFARLREETIQMALRYDDEIKRTHLIDGMVVNLGADGAMLDQCDSLLFSSLRFASLDKLGWRDRALTAWDSIERSQDHGTWLRHPRCYQSMSRDMLVGLLLAMTRNPPNKDRHLAQLMQTVADNHGFFGTGPVYVSYLSPGLARLMTTMAKYGEANSTSVQPAVNSGYSTAELEVMLTPPGYTSHLGGLTAWIEMELIAQGKLPDDHRQTQLLTLLDQLTAPFGSRSLRTQRLEWITDRLVRSDPSNLFFRYLRLKSARALNQSMRARLLTELINMPQFPRDRLPMDCDRRSDYLWQRADKKANTEPIACNVEYSGVDFLWMASLLLEDQIGN